MSFGQSNSLVRDCSAEGQRRVDSNAECHVKYNFINFTIKHLE